MRTNKICIILIIVIFSGAISTLEAQCPNSDAEIELDANNITANLRLAGDFWWDGFDGRYSFTASSAGVATPSSLFFGGLWISGLDPAGNIYNSINFYGEYVQNSFGPVNANFDRFWEVRKQDIDQHSADYEDNGVIDGPIPTSILSWPAMDNPHFFEQHGFALPGDRESLAPFVDLNGNSIYEPMLGEIPDIKGATQGIWWMFTDECNDTPEYLKVGVEIHALAYVYESEEPALNNTSFYELNIFKWDQNSLDSVYISLFVDPDLGCPFDDFIGFNRECDVAYAYNSDGLDGTAECNCSSGILSYCDEIPIVGIKFLDNTSQDTDGNPAGNKVSSFIYSNNSAVGSPIPNTTDPQTAIEVFRYQNGYWRDGAPLIRGGDGFDPTSTELTSYAFHDDPDDPNGWSMCSTDLAFNDRRLYINSGPYQFDSETTSNRLNFAVIMVENIEHPCPDITPLLEACQVVESHYNDITSHVEELTSSDPVIELDVFPNPMSARTQFSFVEPDRKITGIELYTCTGQLVRKIEGLQQKVFELDRMELDAGLYYYRILTDKDKIVAGKLIIL